MRKQIQPPEPRPQSPPCNRTALRGDRRNSLPESPEPVPDRFCSAGSLPAGWRLSMQRAPGASLCVSRSLLGPLLLKSKFPELQVADTRNDRVASPRPKSGGLLAPFAARLPAMDEATDKGRGIEIVEHSGHVCPRVSSCDGAVRHPHHSQPLRL